MKAKASLKSLNLNSRSIARPSARRFQSGSSASASARSAAVSCGTAIASLLRLSLPAPCALTARRHGSRPPRRDGPRLPPRRPAAVPRAVVRARARARRCRSSGRTASASRACCASSPGCCGRSPGTVERDRPGRPARRAACRSTGTCRSAARSPSGAGSTAAATARRARGWASPTCSTCRCASSRPASASARRSLHVGHAQRRIWLLDEPLNGLDADAAARWSRHWSREHLRATAASRWSPRTSRSTLPGLRTPRPGGLRAVSVVCAPCCGATWRCCSAADGAAATLLPVLFFLAVAMLFPFAVGPDARAAGADRRRGDLGRGAARRDPAARPAARAAMSSAGSSTSCTCAGSPRSWWSRCACSPTGSASARR